MADFRTRNKTVLAKVETVSGTEQVPSISVDAIACEDSNWNPNFETLDTNEHTGSLDSEAPIVGGGGGQHSCAILLKGSGAAATPPEYAPFLRAAAFAESITSSPITGVAQAGSSSTITLAAGASSVDNFYRGMPIKITDSTGDGQIVMIAAYNGTTKVATVTPNWNIPTVNGSDYQIMTNVRYLPASTGLETMTLYEYQHNSLSGGQSLLRKLIGAACNLSLEVTTRGIGRMTANSSGKVPANPANVAHPGAGVFDTTRPPVFMAANAWLGGAAVKFNRCSLDLGNTVQQADDPAATFGLDTAGVVTRNMTGSINPQLALLSVRNNFADFLGGTEKVLLLNWGSALGNRVSILCPRVHYTGAAPTDVNGFASEEMPFRAVGADAGAIITFF